MPTAIASHHASAPRLCEERSDEAIQAGVETRPLDCFASLAMTAEA
jgi:hypothetical protein